jgi:heme exporter protein CcmD
MSLREFLHMSGYAGYVWTAYGLTAAVLLLNWVSARRSEAEQIASAQRRMTTDKENRA